MHPWSRIAAGTDSLFLPVGIGDDRSALCHSITHRILEPYGVEEVVGFFVEGSSTDNNLLKLSAEGIGESIVDLGLDSLVGDRKPQQESHSRSGKERKQAVLVNLLDDQGNGDDDLRLDFLKRLDYHAWRRNPGKEVHVSSYCHFIQELEHHSVHMCGWQYGYHIGCVIHGRQYLVSEQNI